MTTGSGLLTSGHISAIEMSICNKIVSYMWRILQLPVPQSTRIFGFADVTLIIYQYFIFKQIFVLIKNIFNDILYFDTIYIFCVHITLIILCVFKEEDLNLLPNWKDYIIGWKLMNFWFYSPSQVFYCFMWFYISHCLLEIQVTHLVMECSVFIDLVM